MFGIFVNVVSRLSSLNVRQPIIKSLACFFLAVIILQYSGILLLTQRYTMSRFYDVMLLMSNHSSNATGSRRSILQQGITEKKMKFPEQSRQKHFIAHYLKPPKFLDEDSSKDEELYEGNNKVTRTSNVLKDQSQKNSQNVPGGDGQMPGDKTWDKQFSSDMNSKSKGQSHVIPHTKTDDLQGSRSSFMGPFWNIVYKLRHGFIPTAQTELPQNPCQVELSGLEDPVSVIFSAPEWADLEKHHPEVRAGGHWSPRGCKSQHKVALVIPFRERDHHLRVFLQHIHPFLQKQLIDYTILVIEQTTDSDFNRAMLMNIGFMEGEMMSGFDCYIFHDVDLLPEVLQNFYNCPHLPRHMSAAIDTFGYRLPYTGIFGGVSALRTEHFRRVNGFSNCFFGWGGEDDDMYNRIKYHGLDITRYPLHVARYRMISHKKQDPSDDRFRMLNTGRLRFETDGLSSLKYEVVLHEKRPLYTLIKVKINKDDVVPKDLPFDTTATPPSDQKLTETTGTNHNHREIGANERQEGDPSSLTIKDGDSRILDNLVSDDERDEQTRRNGGHFGKSNSRDIEARLNKALNNNGGSQTLYSHKIEPESRASESGKNDNKTLKDMHGENSVKAGREER